MHLAEHRRCWREDALERHCFALAREAMSWAYTAAGNFRRCDELWAKREMGAILREAVAHTAAGNFLRSLPKACSPSLAGRFAPAFPDVPDIADVSVAPLSLEHPT